MTGSRHFIRSAALVAAVVGFSGSALQADMISYVAGPYNAPGQVQVTTSQGDLPYGDDVWSYDYDELLSIPETGTTSSHLRVNNVNVPSADATYDVSHSGFNFTASLKRNGESYSRAQMQTAYPIFFTVDEDMSYEISGAFSMTTATDDLGYYKMQASLFDWNDPFAEGAVFYDQTWEYYGDSTNPSFEFDGDGGSLTGTLLVGHTYFLYTEFDMMAQDGAGYAEGDGWFSLAVSGPSNFLRMSNVSAVPEPTSLASLALVGLLIGRRRRPIA